MLGFWRAGGSGYYGTGGYDPTGLLQKVFGLADHMRHVGADGYHRDCGWWDAIGNWNGPDWRQTGDYLAEVGDPPDALPADVQLAERRDRVQRQPGVVAAQGVPCSENSTFGSRLIDLLDPGRGRLDGRTLLRQRGQVGRPRLAQRRLPDRQRQRRDPAAAERGARRSEPRLPRRAPGLLDPVRQLGRHRVRLGADPPLLQQRRSPTTEATPRSTTPRACSRSTRSPGMPDLRLARRLRALVQLHARFHAPDYTGTTSDPAKLECLREVVERYRYLKATGVAGRWIRYYHPSGTGVQRAWLQRVARDGTKSVLLLGRDQSGAVTVYPKGLNPAGQLRRSASSSGPGPPAPHRRRPDEQRDRADQPADRRADLGSACRSGPAPAATERRRPRPASVTARYETNMSYPGVGLSWTAASDDHFLSGYDVLPRRRADRRRQQGHLLLRPLAGGGTQSTYAVRAFDADGNRGPAVSTTPTATDATVLDGAAGAARDTAAPGAIRPAESRRTPARCRSPRPAVTPSATCFEGSGVTWYAKLGPGNGKAAVTIDGRERTVVDLFAPDETNWRIPVFSRTWNSTARAPDRDRGAAPAQRALDRHRRQRRRPAGPHDAPDRHRGRRLHLRRHRLEAPERPGRGLQPEHHLDRLGRLAGVRLHRLPDRAAAASAGRRAAATGATRTCAAASGPTSPPTTP